MQEAIGRLPERQRPAGYVLQSYHDGELEQRAASDVAAHLEQCAACRRELAELGRINRLLADVPAPELPRGVWPRVRPGRAREPRLQPALVFAACAIGVVLGILIGPIRFGGGEVVAAPTRTETVKPWGEDVSSSLLTGYQAGLD